MGSKENWVVGSGQKGRRGNGKRVEGKLGSRERVSRKKKRDEMVIHTVRHSERSVESDCCSVGFEPLRHKYTELHEEN